MGVAGVVIPELIALVTEGEPASHGIGRWLIEEAEDLTIRFVVYAILVLLVSQKKKQK
jgi:hypothetical protein